LPDRARLLERGVRFVQLWSGATTVFRGATGIRTRTIARDHADMGTSMDKPAAALIKDLKARGLLGRHHRHLDDGVRADAVQPGRRGRDHNPFAFTSWLAGGGIRGGVTYGASDEWSFRARKQPTYCYDVHATVLHQLGIDHERLTFRHNGIDRRLTDVHGHVIHEILA